MDIQAHWQALYDALVAGLTAGGNGSVPVLHVDSTEEQTGNPVDPPFVVYTGETFRPTGTTGSGPNKVVKDGWRITARARDLADVLDYLSNIVTELEQEEDAIAVTSDGYTTTAVTILGIQTLYETDGKLNAGHLRIEWERSA